SDELVILRRDEIWLDVVRSEVDRELIRGKRVLGPVTGRASMSDDDRPAIVMVVPVAKRPGARRDRASERSRNDDQDRKKVPAPRGQDSAWFGRGAWVPASRRRYGRPQVGWVTRRRAFGNDFGCGREPGLVRAGAGSGRSGPLALDQRPKVGRGFVAAD